MDASRYNRIRDLFLAAEELPPGEQELYLQSETAGDVDLLEEVVSLLAEHDPLAAKTEGECAQPVTPPNQLAGASGDLSGSDLLNTDALKSTRKRGQSTIDSSLATPKMSRTTSNSNRGLVTQQGALRTHASPRYGATPRPKKPSSPSSMPIWAERTRKNRRRTSGWLWLAALLPTALVGWWTYRAVDDEMRRSIEIKLEGTAENLALSSDRFLTDHAQMVQSWGRQPLLRESIIELAELSETDPSMQQMKDADQISMIHDQLRELSGNEDVKFVVWNDSFQIMASWLEDRADVGNPVHPSGASNLARVMAGETVLFGPIRLTENSVGFVPETSSPVMSVIVPIEDQHSKVIAAMLVRGLSCYEKFNQLFADTSAGISLDAYAVNRDSVMVTDSFHATSLATRDQFDLEPGEISTMLRVSDPGFLLTRSSDGDLRRDILPITIAAAGATSKSAEVRTQPYPNYAGEMVVGAWHWLPEWNLGIIVEENAAVSFAPSRLVRFSFLLLGSLLSITGFLAAARIASRSTAEHAAVHPLSRYEVLGELGSGGMGVVYRGRHLQLGRDVALKLLRGDRHADDDRLRFDREAKLAASLSSPHSVMIYDYGRSEEGESFCVMQFLRGLTLQEVVARSGHQSIGRVLTILRQICDAIAEAHSMNLMHRDIKPQNVMLSLDPTVGDWAVVFDYGLAKPLETDADAYQTSETIWAGTPMYMSPERFREPTKMDPRSDLYSIGCVAYYLLTGRPPFIESDPESLFSLILAEQPISIGIHRSEEFDQEVSNLVMKCMAKRADDRFATVAELAREIDRLRVRFGWSIDQAKVWWSHHGGD